MNLITNQKALRQAISNAKSIISDTELFLSTAYLSFLKHMIDGVTKRFEQPVLLDISSQDENITACTDGNKIYVNINNYIIQKLDRKGKHSAIIATVLHECAHILFTDFKLALVAYKKLSEENILYPQPTTCTEVQNLNTWLLSNNTGKNLLKLYQSLDNCIEDGYVDNRIISYIPGYGLNRVWYKKILSADIPTYEEMVADPNMDSIAIIINMVLAYAKYGMVKYDKDSSSNDEIIKIFFSMKIHIDEAIKENNSLERRRKINYILSCMFSIIENEWNKHQNMQNQQNDSSSTQTECSNSNQAENSNNNSSDSSSQNSSSNSPDGTQSNSNEKTQNSSSSENSSFQSQIQSNMTASNFQQALNNSTQSIEQGRDENHSNTQVLKTPDSSTSGELSQAALAEDNNSQTNNTSSESELEQILIQAAKDSVAKEQEKSIEEQLNRNLSVIANNKFHHNVVSSIERVPLTTRGIQRYEDMHTELDAIARRLVKNLDKEIRERKLGDTLNGLYMGKRLDNRSLYREDKKIFTKKIQPENIPDMEVSLLIDLSGSMGGERIHTSMQATYILYSFANILKIPVSVYGHHVNGQVKMHSYTDSTSLDGLDKKRIFEMDASGCNRDGYALRFCLDRLRTSDATTKIMLIISDGCPNDSGYHFDEAKTDIQEAVADAKKHGIITIAAAIGDDCDNIKALYTDGISEKKAALFLDISELERLPKTFPQILKKYLS